MVKNLDGQMSVKPETIELLNLRFKYTPDTSDSWRALTGSMFTLLGDCDDYALTVALIRCKWSWLRFWWGVLTLRFMFLRVSTPTGAHMVLRERGKGYIESHGAKWSDENPYPLKFPWLILPPVIAVKILLGK